MIAFLPPFGPPNQRAQDLILRVEEALGRYDRGQVAGAARRIYRFDRRWMPPIYPVRANALRPESNPLLAGAELGAFLGIAQNLGLGDETVGSIAAWSMPTEDEYAGGWGAWGQFETINVEEMAERLFGAAEMWLFEHAGALVGIRGPLPLEPLASPGLLTDGFDVEPAALLPYNPPYYPEMVEAQGYERALTWRAYRLDLPSTSQPNASASKRPATEDWAQILAAFQAAGEENGQAQLVAGLSTSLAHLAGEEPMKTSWAWRQTVGRAFGAALGVVVQDETEGAAACFAIPEPGPAFRLAGGRLLPFGWLLFGLGLRRTQQVRVFPAFAPEDWDSQRVADLYRELAKAAATAGYRQATIAPIPDEDERSRAALALLHARPVQQFTVYEKRF